MDENKKDFLESLGDLMCLYSRENVDGIAYTTDGAREYADIHFTSGGSERVAITGDSCIMAMIDIAKALLSGADGGHVVLYPSENPDRILIMDTADVSTAQSCLQLNKNGLGFWTKGKTSTTPLTGTYTNAWTIDGNKAKA